MEPAGMPPIFSANRRVTFRLTSMADGCPLSGSGCDTSPRRNSVNRLRPNRNRSFVSSVCMARMIVVRWAHRDRKCVRAKSAGREMISHTDRTSRERPLPVSMIGPVRSRIMEDPGE